MRNASRLAVGIVCCVALAGVSRAMAEDWPQWRGPNRDGKVTGFKAPATWPKELKQGWKVSVGQGDAGPVLVGDKIYLAVRQDNDELTLCLNAEDGKEVWRDKHPAPMVGGADKGHAGPRGTPVVADGKVVTLGVGGAITCLDAAKGTLLWRNEDYKSVPKFHTACSPLIADGMVVVQVGSEKDGAVVALNLADGKEKWKLADEGPQYSSPVLMTADGVKQVVALTSKSVVGVGLADGKKLWEVAFPVTGMAYNAATPIVDGQTVIFTGQGRGTKAVKIAKSGDAFAATDVWTNKELGAKFASMVLKDGMLFGISDKGQLFCLNAKDGVKVWTSEVKSSGYGALLDVGSAVLAMPDKGELVAFKSSEKGCEELGKYKVADTAVYACPLVSGNKIYVKDQSSLTVYTVE